MLAPIDRAGTFLEPQHDLGSAAGYSRNLIYQAPDDSLSSIFTVCRACVPVAAKSPS